MEINQDKNSWFEAWFDSHYYHLLYKNRDYIEAEHFIKNLLNYLQPTPNCKMLDVACGKGRHAIYINKLGYKTDAFDLSENSILEAKNHENNGLRFYINDIRQPLKSNYYDCAFNLFTSFGYFSDENDNQQSVDAMASSLKKDGVLVIDFLNVNHILSNLKTLETKKIEHITFDITKEIDNGFIIKHIKFNDNNTDFHFTERVKMLLLTNFKNYLSNSGLTLTAIFGDYSLNPFDEKNSERLIIIAKKQ
ncbi:MAG: class I SAM-dependent methyltransferase [Flavobacteriales bacterium]